MALTPRWTKLRSHLVQHAYWHSPHRFNTVPAGRRSGKTELAKRKLVKRALMGTDFYPARFFAAAPTRDQAKRIYWDDLKRLVPGSLRRSVSETDLCIVTPLSELWVVGMDKPERIEGQPWDGGILDEYGNMKAHAWGAHVRPALSDRTGWCDIIGVPEGRNHYYDTDREARALMREYGSQSEWGAYHWVSADILPPEEVEAARRDLDELTFQQEFEASFVNFQGRAYYPFLEHTHCARLEYNPKAPLIVCFDFNVAPGVAAIGQEMRLPNGLEGTGWIGEAWIPQNSNTPLVCRRILTDWAGHEGPVLCYGDATGGARGSAKVSGSDWDIIRDVLVKGIEDTPGFGDRVRFRVPKANPPERSRVNAVNTRLKNGAGEIRMMVDPHKAPHLQRDFEGVQVVEGGSGEIDKKKDLSLTHISDAAGYYVVAEFPLEQSVFVRRKNKGF